MVMRWTWLYGFGSWPFTDNGVEYIITFGLGWIYNGKLEGIAWMKKVKP
jgi:hypothetical protein